MCYDATASRNAFVLGMLSSYLLYQQPGIEAKVVSLWLAYIILMQGFDYLFWSFPRSSPINQIATRAATLIHLSQPLMLVLLLYLYKRQLCQSTWIAAIVYFCIAFAYLILHWSKIQSTGVTPASAPVLEWSWNHYPGCQLLYGSCLVVGAIILYNEISFGMATVLSVFIISTLAYSLYKFRIYKSFGRFWCLYIAFLPLLVWLFLKLQ